MSGRIFFFDWEVNLILFIQQHLGSAGIFLLSLISEFGEEVVIVAIIGYLYWGIDKKFGRYLAQVTLVNLVVNGMLKGLFMRRRPYFDNEAITPLKPADPSFDTYDVMGQGYSFPSGHSSNVTSVFGALYYYTKKKILLLAAAVIILLVGISRFALGVHYPTDVFFGWLEGLLVLWLINTLTEKLSRNTLYLLLGAVSLTGFFFCKSADYYTGVGLLLGFLLGDLFQERYIRFENTDRPLIAVIRAVGGAVVLLAISSLCKLPFPKELLDSAGTIPYLIRTGRYLIATFLSISVYPLCFRYPR